MLEDENRNCNCMPNNMANMNVNMNWAMQNSMNSVQNNNMSECECNEFNQTRADMIERIKCLNFAIIELGLYLDTHPDDEKALCLHRKYCKEYRELTDKYQKVYGPLTIQFPCNKWRWLEEPWPSFILRVTTYLQFFLVYLIRKTREKM